MTHCMKKENTQKNFLFLGAGLGYGWCFRCSRSEWQCCNGLSARHLLSMLCLIVASAIFLYQFILLFTQQQCHIPVQLLWTWHFLISRGLQGPLHFQCFSCKNTNTQTHTDIRPCNHIAIHTSSLAHAEMSAVFLPQVPSHIRPTLIIKGRGVRVVPLSVQLRAGDPLIHSSGFVWASGLTHLPTPQASAGPRSEGRLLFSSNNCS